MKTCNVYSIANFIIGTSKEVTNLKLQKMLYYLQMFTIGKYGKPLFYENIEAWTYGPVVPDAYYKFKKHEDNVIRHIIPNEEEIEDDELRFFLIKNIRILDEYSAMDLIRLSRKVGTPWSIVWGRGEGRLGLIPINLISDYYESIMNNKSV